MDVWMGAWKALGRRVRWACARRKPGRNRDAGGGAMAESLKGSARHLKKHLRDRVDRDTVAVFADRGKQVFLTRPGMSRRPRRQVTWRGGRVVDVPDSKSGVRYPRTEGSESLPLRQTQDGPQGPFCWTGLSGLSQLVRDLACGPAWRSRLCLACGLAVAPPRVGQEAGRTGWPCAMAIPLWRGGTGRALSLP